MKNRTFLLLLLLSFFCWFLPFILRIFFIELPEINEGQVENSHGIIEKITQSMSEDDKQKVFVLIGMNNLKGCILNITGGVMLGLGTLLNLVYNGFFSADMFANSYKAGLSIETIFKITLPHSFELIGLWLSGAIGFYIAWNLIQFMSGKGRLTSKFYKTVGLYSLITFILIISAAYVEAYISTQIK